MGDRYADLEMAHAAGGRGILVMTGYGRGEYELHRSAWPRQPDALAENLSDAVRHILRAAIAAAMTEGEERFLVVRLTALGDILHTVPAVAALRAAHPSATNRLGR